MFAVMLKFRQASDMFMNISINIAIALHASRLCFWTGAVRFRCSVWRLSTAVQVCRL